MKLLLTAATQQEMQPYLSTGPLHDVLITGVGIAAATHKLTRHLLHHHYDLVLQAGIAGSFTNAYQMGSVVTVAKDAFADLGVWENGQIQSLSDMGLSNDNNWHKGSAEWLGKIALPQVNAITVATVTNNSAFTDALQNRWGADIETMEGAACYYVGAQLQKPCLQIRSISNIVGERNKDNWQTEKAIANLNSFLQQFIGGLLRK